MTVHDIYMRRCFDLALKGGSDVLSNPHVGAAIVHDNVIIGEGYHRKYGEEHAEINALRSVKINEKVLLKHSTMYISLEPCYHWGKTPPCVQAILENNIKTVVISTTDPNPKVMGKSIDLLQSRGVEVKYGILQNEGKSILRRFNANLQSLPFITIKFAQSNDNFIGKKGKRVQISSEDTSIFTHKLRAQNDGILIGSNTCIIDDPNLTTRHYPGSDPIRIVLDRYENIPKSAALLRDKGQTLIFTLKKNYQISTNKKEVITLEFWSLAKILEVIYSYKIHSLIIEGGQKIIKWFVKENLWHDAFIITAEKVSLNEGIKAPNITGRLIKTFDMKADKIHHIRNEEFCRG
ncbi:MAG: bifunctional diaminohydroxyphosphoribosylaminopyrimidine deaminase/5-amino-6-(5-phosphoribosylamino)uracil reductase RibD [Saprospiraceae bacterium]